MGVGVIVQLTPSEAKEVIPKIKELLRQKVESAKSDLAKACKTRKNFEDSFLNLKIALDPVVARLGL
jgi:hypothetical protein